MASAWLTLGPANDTPEAVQIEIRAAELAALVADAGNVAADVLTVGEGIGWDVFGLDDDEYDHLVTLPRNAGWLARQIATHDTEQCDWRARALAAEADQDDAFRAGFAAGWDEPDDVCIDDHRRWSEHLVKSRAEWLARKGTKR